MPYGNTGKIIESISSKRKHIVITFLTGETLTITPDQFTQGYYYVGKVLGSKEYEDIIQASQTQPLIEYGFKLLSKGRYAEYQIREKLYHRKATKPQVDEVIERLKQAHLIDDQTLMKDWVHHFQLRGYGERVIQEKLFEKKFSKALIQTIILDQDIEKDKISQLAFQLNQKYKRFSQRLRVETIKRRLLERGYPTPLILSALTKLPEEDPQQEKANLLEDIQKAKRLYKKRFQGYALQEKLINFLLRKGYNYSIIKRQLKEFHHGD
ncbi:MAG: hypothetical protein ACO22H_03435 [Bacilli bacterium]